MEAEVFSAERAPKASPTVSPAGHRNSATTAGSLGRVARVHTATQARLSELRSLPKEEGMPWNTFQPEQYGSQMCSEDSQPPWGTRLLLPGPVSRSGRTCASPIAGPPTTAPRTWAGPPVRQPGTRHELTGSSQGVSGVSGVTPYIPSPRHAGIS